MSREPLFFFLTVLVENRELQPNSLFFYGTLKWRNNLMCYSVDVKSEQPTKNRVWKFTLLYNVV